MKSVLDQGDPFGGKREALIVIFRILLSVHGGGGGGWGRGVLCQKPIGFIKL